MSEDRSPMRRILSLALPFLPTDRLQRESHGRSWRSHPERARIAASPPLAVVARIDNALRLVALDEIAVAVGLTRGMPLADARAMIPALIMAEENSIADSETLTAIATWAERYTPLVALDAASGAGLMLDVTGCAHLFGGEAAMVDDIVTRLGSNGFLARAAVAGTPGAAFAAARYTDTSVIAPGAVADLLAPLPLAALRLDHAIVAALDRVGLKRIGQIMDAPRAPLAARFGAGLIRRLDQALGRDEEAIDPRRPPPVFIAERRFPEPIVLQDDIAATLASLAATLALTLERHGEGARQIEFTLFRVDGVVTRIAVGASRPVRAPRLILDLFREKFAALGDDEIEAGFGFDMARLAVTVSAPAEAAQIDLTGEATAAADLDGLIDRIGARLGPGSVGAIVPRQSHLPERNQAFVQGNRNGKSVEAARTDAPSPLRLFAHPEPVEAVAEVPDGPPVRFRWRRALYSVARAEGPERIAAEWWREDALTRDYFRVEDAEGHRFWLYREGLYEREVGTPRWYLHGVFA